MREPRLPLKALIALPAVAALALTACGDSDDDAGSATASATVSESATASAPAGEITVSDAWSRQPAEGQTTSAVYATVSNGTDADVTIVGATASVSDKVELHEMIMGDDGTMTMKQKEGGFVVPAGGTFAFESGGPHIMMFDVDPATYPDTVDVTIELDNGSTVAFSAEVRAIDESMDMGGSSSGSDTGMDMSGTAEESSDHHHGAVDADALHELHEQLSDGTLDTATQRPVVAEAIAALMAEGEPAAGTPEADMLAVLQELDAALVAGDLAAATAAADTAHEAAHDLEDHG